MEIAMKDDKILMRKMDNTQYLIIRNCGKCTWDKKSKMLVGNVDIDLLDTLDSIVKLPEKIQSERKKLHAVRDAINKQRLCEEPKALVHYPVKLPLFKHQIRGANMALIAFGAVDPERSTNEDDKENID